MHPRSRLLFCTDMYSYNDTISKCRGFFSDAGKADDAVRMEMMDQTQDKINVNEIVGKISTLLGGTDDEIAVHRKYQNGIWPVRLKGDQIDRILFSFCLNACYAMPNGGHLYLETVNVLLDSKAAKTLALKPGRYVKVSVTDTGVHQKVIVPLVRKQEERKDWKDRLDRNVAYGIVRHYGGIIVLTRKEGNGTTFGIYLPTSENEVGWVHL